MPNAKDYAGNATTGAAMGGTIGAIGGPAGMAIGAGGGALIGLGYTALGGGNLLSNLSGGNVNPNSRFRAQDEFRKAQIGGLNTVGNWALTGNGPSQAQSQLTQAREQNNMAAVGAAKAMAGGNPALQANLTSQMLAKQNAATGYESAQLRAKEQQDAMGNYLKGLQGARESDVDVGKAKAAIDVHNADAKGGFVKGLMGGAAGGLGKMF